jgi:hypothetical protein
MSVSGSTASEVGRPIAAISVMALFQTCNSPSGIRSFSGASKAVPSSGTSNRGNCGNASLPDRDLNSILWVRVIVESDVDNRTRRFEGLTLK